MKDTAQLTLPPPYQDCALYTDWHRNIALLGGRKPNGYSIECFYYYTEKSIYTYETYKTHTHLVESESDVYRIEKNLQKKVSEVKEYIKEEKAKEPACKALIETLKGLKVRKSEVTTLEIIQDMKRKEKNRDICWPSHSDTKVLNGRVVFPRGFEPFFYHTTANLHCYKEGDVVEVTFGNGYRVSPGLRDKTFTYVVSNTCVDMTYYRRLALIPNKDNWSKRSIIFLGNTQRFEDLMSALFSINRVPYRGCHGKQVKIRKKGHRKTQPLYKGRNEPTLTDLRTISDDDYSQSYDSGGHVCGVRKGDYKGLELWRTIKVTTSEDVRIARAYLLETIKRSKERLGPLKNTLRKHEGMLFTLKKFWGLMHETAGE